MAKQFNVQLKYRLRLNLKLMNRFSNKHLCYCEENVPPVIPETLSPAPRPPKIAELIWKQWSRAVPHECDGGSEAALVYLKKKNQTQ